MIQKGKQNWSHTTDNAQQEYPPLNVSIELVDYIIYVYYEQCKSADKSLLWELYSDVVLNNVKNNSDHYYKIVESEDGQEFFGKKFILQEVAK